MSEILTYILWVKLQYFQNLSPGLLISISIGVFNGGGKESISVSIGDYKGGGSEGISGLKKLDGVPFWSCVVRDTGEQKWTTAYKQ